MFGDTEWMADAACRLDPNWTSTIEYSGGDHGHEVGPDPYTQMQLETICMNCPVIRSCGRYALHNNCDGGMYAGVWLPRRYDGRRHTDPSWVRARTELRRRIRAVAS